MADQTIHTRDLKLAANYIECVREVIKDLYPIIPMDIKEKYKMAKLENGLIDIQFPGVE